MTRKFFFYFFFKTFLLPKMNFRWSKHSKIFVPLTIFCCKFIHPAQFGLAFFACYISNNVPTSEHHPILSFAKKINEITRWIKFFKAHMFWEGHKILRNLHLLFVLCTDRQIMGGDFAKFCGLLRIYEICHIILRQGHLKKWTKQWHNWPCLYLLGGLKTI